MVSITVIIPARNAAAFIQEAVESLQNQTFSNWEAIIINDGSDDETGHLADIINEAESRVHVVHKPISQGLSAARNTGLELAQGEFIQFLDADDKLLPHKLETQLAYLAAHPACDMVCGSGQYFDTHGPVPTEYPPPLGSALATLLTRNYILVNAALTRKSAIENVGLFKEASSTRLPVYGCEDWDFWLRIAINGGQIHWLDSTLVHNRWHQANMSKETLLMQRSYVWVLEEAERNRPLLSNWHQALLTSQLFCRRALYVLALFESGDSEEAKQEAKICAEQSAGMAKAFFLTQSTFGQPPIGEPMQQWAWSLIPRLTRRLGRIATAQL
ncbi:MAG: glycosyltransferase [Deltaproteobacteria bacterium]|jgi:glycosyltransferase involved in cell wall biosynthesis|nr:glycosyltransferase [Deltaproteobacteria bacterium]MBT6435816.1 glycosyltransferase [Deltaproteobacteria bacterium]